MVVAYVAEPVDMGEMSEKKVRLVIETLNEYGFTTFRPRTAFSVGGKPDGSLQAINELALERADVVFAFMQEGQQSIGVPIEIQTALAMAKPVVLASDLTGSWIVASWAERENFRSVGLGSKDLRSGCDWLLHTYNDLHFGTASKDFGRTASPISSVWVDSLTELGKKLKEQSESSRVVRPSRIVFEAKAENAKLPERAYDTDAGFDLFVSRNTMIPAGKTVYVPCGVAVDVPDGWWGLITGRSSTKRKLGLDVTQGVIDEGFSGELFAAVTNPHPHQVNIAEGDRLVQIVFIPAVGSEGAQWGTVREKARGANGFGSSGKSDMHESEVPTVDLVTAADDPIDL